MEKNTILRCYYCNQCVLQSEIHRDGACVCGSRKMRVAWSVSAHEMDDLKSRGFVPVDGQITEDRDEAWVEEK